MNPHWLAGLRGTQVMPCLLVADLAQAVDHYQNVLGFTSAELLGDPPAAALLRRPEGSVVLQPSSAAGPYTNRRYGWSAWDAVFHVTDLDRVAADLRRYGARGVVGIGVTPVGEHTLEVRDAWGNVLAFTATTAGLRPALHRLVPTGARVALRDRRLARIEQPHLDAFQAFYDRLPDRQDVFYMFFAGGLLHWVTRAARLVPPEVNLVLVGSDIPADEREFIRAHLDRPFHNVELGIDDNTAWEFLFAVNRHHFGYLDIDCFVLAPGVFAEMARIDPDVAVNATWTYEAAPGLPIGCTHFAFVNVDAVAALRRAGRYLSPTNYDFRGATISYLHNRTYCRVPSRRQRRMLLEALPADENGRPLPPGNAPFFDTLVCYQVVAGRSGYRTHPVRPLVHRTAADLARARPDSPNGRRQWQQDMTDELVHVGGVSYYGKYFHLPEFRVLYLAAEWTLLAGAEPGLPEYYDRRRAQLEAELEHLGISTETAADLVRRHLTADRGLSTTTVDRILGTGTVRPQAVQPETVRSETVPS